MSYLSEYQDAIENPEEYWRNQAQKIHWFTFPETILSKDKQGHYHWFEGGKLNTCYLALDQHVLNGRGDQPALIYDSPVTNNKRSFTYNDLLEQVSLFAGVLADLGIEKKALACS